MASATSPMAKLRSSKRAQPKTSGDNSCGLANLGNTCFMNSALQCLTHMPDLRDYFLEDLHLREINTRNPLGRGGRIAKSFGDVMKSVWQESVSSFSPRQFKQIMGQEYRQFHGFSQQDSQEFMTVLLDGIHEDLNRVLVKPHIAFGDDDTRSDDELARESWKYFCARNQSVIVDLFFGMIRSTVTCIDCNHVSVKFDPVNQLCCPLPDSNDRFVQFYFMKNACSRPRKTRLAASCDATIGEFLDVVSSTENVPQSHLVFVELFRTGYVKAVLRNDQRLADVAEAETVKLFVYALPNKFSSASRRSIADSFTVVSKKSSTNNRRKALEHAAQQEEESNDDWTYAGVCICIASDDDDFSREDKENEVPNGAAEKPVDCRVSTFDADVAHDRECCSERLPMLRTSESADCNGANVQDTTFNASKLNSCHAEKVKIELTKPAENAEGGPVVAHKPNAPVLSAAKSNASGKPLTAPFLIRVRRDEMPVSELFNVLQASMQRFSVKSIRPNASDDAKDTDFEVDPDNDSGISDGGTGNDAVHTIEGDAQRATPSPATSTTQSLCIDGEEFLSTTLSESNTGYNVTEVPPHLYSTSLQPARDFPFYVAELGSNDVNDIVQEIHVQPLDDADAVVTFHISSNSDADVETRSKNGKNVKSCPSSAVAGADNLAFLCVNVRKDYAENAHLFDQSELSRCDTDIGTAPAVHKTSADASNFVDINDCLRTFLKPERLSESEMWHCKVCGEPKRAEKKLDLWYLPKYLVVHLKRFSYSRWSRDKLRQRVRINESIDMSHFVKNGPKPDKPLIYDFVAVSNHSGGLGAGHYWAYAQDRDGRWVELNDSHVASSSYADASGHDVGDETCYMVFFKLRQFHYDLEKLPVRLLGGATDEKSEARADPVADADEKVEVLNVIPAKTESKQVEKNSREQGKRQDKEKLPVRLLGGATDEKSEARADPVADADEEVEVLNVIPAKTVSKHVEKNSPEVLDENMANVKIRSSRRTK